MDLIVVFVAFFHFFWILIKEGSQILDEFIK
jgi:hypothetical protein